jgi:putative membrane protein
MIPGYASILHNHLKDEETNQQLFDGVDLEIDHHKHKPNQVAKMLFQKINDLYDSKNNWRSTDYFKRRSKIIY